MATLRFNKNYFILSVVLFLVEVFIAVYVNDKIIRPYVGDFLVVILLYCFFKSFLNVSVIKLAILVLLLAYLIEILQYCKLVYKLGLDDSPVAKTIIGSSFEWTDILAYTLGMVTVLVIEKTRGHSHKPVKGVG